MSSSRELFGGAFRCAIASSFEDISQFRDVPDNQEVFADAETDCSVTIEITEPPSDDSASASIAEVPQLLDPPSFTLILVNWLKCTIVSIS
jgi:hypothetical protein